MQITENDNNEMVDVLEEELNKPDRDFDRIQCCTIVNSYVMEIMKGAHPDLTRKQLREGHTPERLRDYLGIIGEKITTYEDNIESPQLSTEKKKEYERKVEALKFLREKIEIVIEDSKIPDDTVKI